MQGSSNSVKRKRCNNIYCLHPLVIEGNSTQCNQMQGNEKNKTLLMTCFRLPFCIFPIGVTTTGTTSKQEAFVTKENRCNCSKYGRTIYDSDDSDEFIIGQIPHQSLCGTIVPEWNILNSHIKTYDWDIDHDNRSTVASSIDLTTTSNGSSTSCKNDKRRIDDRQSFEDLKTSKTFSDEKIRYISFDTIFNSSSKINVTTSTKSDSCSSSAMDAEQQKLDCAMYQCKNCPSNVLLHVSWKYCPSCGIYLG